MTTSTPPNPRLADIIRMEEVLANSPSLTDHLTPEGKRLPTIQRAAAVIAGLILDQDDFPSSMDSSLVNILANASSHTLMYASSLGLSDWEVVHELCQETCSYIVGTILNDNKVLDRLDQDKYDAAVAVTLNDLLTENTND